MDDFGTVAEQLTALGVTEQEALRCLDWGSIGALHIAKILGGNVIAQRDSTYDVDLGNVRVEIKTSRARLNHTNKQGTVHRACFGKLNGTSGGKIFDAEILVAIWPDHTMSYFLLDLEDTKLFNHDRRNGSTQIAITNGSRQHGKSRDLTENFQISREDLCKIFTKTKVSVDTIPIQFRAMRAKVVKLAKLSF